MEALVRLKEDLSGARTAANGDRVADAAGTAADRLARRHGAHREFAVDCFWALLAFVSAVVMISAGGLGIEQPGQRGLDGLGVAMAAGMSLPLLARRRAPVIVFAAVMSMLAATALLDYPIDIVIGPLVALFTLAHLAGREVPMRSAVVLVAVSYLAVAGSVVVSHGKLPATELAFSGLIWLALWFAGYGSRMKHEHIAWLEERAQRAEAEAEGARALAAAEERTRIARDLHDSAGHAINVILVEAGAARLLRERDPERAEQALATIEDVAREQIDEIDHLVQRLRADDPAAADPLDMTMPAGVPAGPEAGEMLIERMRASGLDLEVEWVGEKVRLGPTVGRGAYRIMQEALTNAHRHGTGSARMLIEFGDEGIEFSVENTMNGQGPAGEGHGLIGMRERVALLGGTLEAGPSDERFRVRVTLPYDCDFDPKRDLPPGPPGCR